MSYLKEAMNSINETTQETVENRVQKNRDKAKAQLDAVEKKLLEDENARKEFLSKVFELLKQQDAKIKELKKDRKRYKTDNRYLNDRVQEMEQELSEIDDEMLYYKRRNSELKKERKWYERCLMQERFDNGKNPFDSLEFSFPKKKRKKMIM